MSKAILGKKLGMTRIFDNSGNSVTVTVVQAGPCPIVQKRTEAKHKYSAIQVGFGAVDGHRLNKPERGVFEKADLKPTKHLREFRMSADEANAYKIGDEITVSIFEEGDFVDVVGTSKGRGYQGVVKRFGFGGNTKTRGTHEHRRHPGSIGNCEFPGRVFKGRRLPGQMGNKRVTTQNLKLIKVDPQENLLMIKGAIPGAKGGLIEIRKAVK